ncbi:hypothetical protein DIS24_g5365 [Lasiodiplodia hormozganensis]|uniref:HNH nuclease domain-containing protein n=1 Tax=Lasiodiplodia hormozganensis TaxID=869390 RepID=A0AA40CXI3_9PEZI|nr:hypothetical protein DIS24_g5365 [Lasiodiplodia hormozganensis]
MSSPASPSAAASRLATPEPPTTPLELKQPKLRSDKTEAKYRNNLKRSREASAEALQKYQKLSTEGSAPGSSRHEHALNMIESAITVLETQRAEAALQVQSLTSIAEKAAQRKLTDEEVKDLESDIRQWTKERTKQEVLLDSAMKQKNSAIEQLADIPWHKCQKVLEMLLCLPILHKRKSRPGQAAWRKAALDFYDSARRIQDPKNKDNILDQVWDPVRHVWAPSSRMRAAHILPYSLSNQVLNVIFGEEDAEHLFDIRNCILLSASVEQALDKGAFVFVPTAESINKPDSPIEYKLVLLEESYRPELVEFPGTTTWNDLDGTVLKFRNDCRPRQRYMYLNYASRIIAARKLKYESHSRTRLETTGTAWVSPGKWIRNSMIREVARIVGDHQMPEVLGEGAFDDDDNEDPDSPTKARVSRAAEGWVRETFVSQLFERPVEADQEEGNSDEEEDDADMFT